MSIVDTPYVSKTNVSIIVCAVDLLTCLTFGNPHLDTYRRARGHAGKTGYASGTLEVVSSGHSNEQ